MKFTEVLENYRQTLAWAVGGSAIIPLLSQFSGLAPNSGIGIVLLSGLYTLALVALAFQLNSTVSKKKLSRTMVISLIAATLILIIYLIIKPTFTYEIPNDPDRTVVTLGCGWSDESLKLIAANPTRYLASAEDSCPGQYRELLRSANYEAKVVYRGSTVSIVQTGIIALWIGFFSAYSFFLGSFISRQTVLNRNNHT
ncbi:hypothetical protein ACMA5I_10795 [Paracoccaceae bacterium GXU_MW_L88]